MEKDSGVLDSAAAEMRAARDEICLAIMKLDNGEISGAAARLDCAAVSVGRASRLLYSQAGNAKGR